MSAWLGNATKIDTNDAGLVVYDSHRFWVFLAAAHRAHKTCPVKQVDELRRTTRCVWRWGAADCDGKHFFRRRRCWNGFRVQMQLRKKNNDVAGLRVQPSCRKRRFGHWQLRSSTAEPGGKLGCDLLRTFLFAWLDITRDISNATLGRRVVCQTRCP